MYKKFVDQQGTSGQHSCLEKSFSHGILGAGEVFRGSILPCSFGFLSPSATGHCQENGCGVRWVPGQVSEVPTLPAARAQIPASFLTNSCNPARNPTRHQHHPLPGAHQLVWSCNTPGKEGSEHTGPTSCRRNLANFTF